MSVPVGHGTSGRRPQLERLNALRGPAALLVVLYHVRQIAVRDMGSANSFEFWRFGHAGVDLFFVISGFVIYLVHRRDFGRSSEVRRFLLRRFIRVYPPLWIVTTGVLLGALVSTHAVHAEKLSLWFIARSYLLWPINGALPLVPPAWTLSHEVKFYLLFTLAIALPARVWKPLLTVVLAGSVMVLYVEWKTAGEIPFAIAFLFSPYNLEFAAGAVLAAVVPNRPVGNPWIWGILGAVLWMTAALHDASLRTSDGAQVVRYGVASALLVLAVTARDIRRPKFHAPALSLLGNASYAIYLAHLPVIIVAVRIANSLHALPAPVTLFAIAVTATCVGIAFHLFVERPITRRLTTRFVARPREAVAT